MLTFLPTPREEPRSITTARAALANAAAHPDATEIGQALDVLAEAIARLSDLSRGICDANARRAISCDRFGLLGTLDDAAIDLRSALEDWAERPENSPRARRAADYADYVNDSMREDAA